MNIQKHSQDKCKLYTRVVLAILSKKPCAELDTSKVIQLLAQNNVSLITLSKTNEADMEWLTSTKEFKEKLIHDDMKYSFWLNELKKLHEYFISSNIKYAIIKSFVMLPYTSGNLDLLVDEKVFDTVKSKLVEEGFIELKNIKEPFKILLKKFADRNKVFPVHLHSRIAWITTILNSQDALNTLNATVEGFSALAPEASLITLAMHSFYENACIKIDDLAQIYTCIHYLNDISIKRLVDLLIKYELLNDAYLLASLLKEIYEEYDIALPKQFNTILNLLEKQGVRVKPLKVEKRHFPIKLPYISAKYKLYTRILKDENISRNALRRVVLASRILVKNLLYKAGVRGIWQKPYLISISGIDGCGKTTISLMLNDLFRECGINSRVVWLRIGSTSKLLNTLTKAMKKALKSRVSAEEYSEREQVRGILAELWWLLNTLHYSLTLKVKLFKAHMLNHVAIFDRYFYDAYVDVLSKSKVKLAPKILKSLYVEPNAKLLIDTPPNIAFQRIRNGPKQLNLLERQYIMYREIAKQYGLEALDGTQPLSNICKELVSKVLSGYYEQYR